MVDLSVSDFPGSRGDDGLRSADRESQKLPSGSGGSVRYLCRISGRHGPWIFGQGAAAISIIGGADGPTSIFLAGKLSQTAIMGPIAVAAYSYMSLVPIIQPPIMKLLTTEKERKIKMEQLRPVSRLERILFPIIVTVVVCVILPTTAPLVGMLMLGNLFRESGVVRQLTETASNALMYIVVILLGTSVGATTSAEAFLNLDTLKIVFLGLIAFMFGTAAGVLLGKVMCVLSGGKVNPLIGSAGVSAVPMAARVSQKVGAEADPTNFLLMHAMGPNVAGVIGTAVVAGTFMAILALCKYMGGMLNKWRNR